MLAGLLRCRELGIVPKTVIDLGAARGDWSRLANTVWPSATYYLFEPLVERKPELDQVTAEHPNFKTVAKAAGESISNAMFTVSLDLDGSGFYGDADHCRMVPQTTLDQEMKSREAESPFFLKFDTHGYELPILSGSERVLQATDAIVMECYGFDIAPTSRRFPEMCEELDQRGFRLADVLEIVRRPGDNLFWQCDAIFIRKGLSPFGRNTYAELDLA